MERHTAPAKRPKFWKALLWALMIEVVVLIITGMSMIRSFFAHSSADSNSLSNNPLAMIGMAFHAPAGIIAVALESFISPVFTAVPIQVLLVAGVIFAIQSIRFRLRQRN